MLSLFVLLLFFVMKRAKNIKNLKAHNTQLGLVKKVYNILNKVDDEDVYFLAFQTFYRI